MKKKLIFSIYGIVTCLIGHASSNSYEIVLDKNPLKISTPSLKKQQILKLRLQNGLEAYIISDPEARESAAALSVEAGSWFDPKEYPGTAHFLEHMLFMGTEKYPNTKEMFEYVNNHHGAINAYTAGDATVYMFSIENKAFDGALDRFSHFFIDPLLSFSAVKQELKAVDQEHDKNIEHDGWREWSIFKETGNPKHPNHMFSTGNAKTLGQIPVTVLRQWYEKYYSADKMHLTIYSNQDINTLKELVVNNFSEIKKREAYDYPDGPLTSEKQKGKITYIQPIKDLKKLTLSWELPEEFFNSSALTLVELYLMNKGENTLYHHLLKQGLIENIYADFERISKKHGIFEIDISLTSKGVQQISQIIEEVFQTLAFIKSNPIPKHFYEQEKTMQLVNYEFQSRLNAFDIIGSHAHQLIFEPLSTYPYQSKILQSYNEQQQKQFLNYLTPKEAIIFVKAPSKLTEVEPDRQEKWLGGKYSTVEMDKDFLDKLCEATPSEYLAYPKPNPYLPKHLEIQNNPLKLTQPMLIENSDLGQVYYYPDHVFGTPQTNITLGIKSPLLSGTPMQSTLLDLYLYTLKKHMSPMLSQASQGGLNVALVKDQLSLVINILGYSEHAPKLTSEVVNQMKTFIPTEEQFKQAKEKILSAYENQSFALPIIQGFALLKNLLVNDAPTANQQLKVLKKIQYEDLLEFSDLLFKQIYIEGLYSGNITKESSEQSFQQIKSLLQPKIYPKLEQHKLRVLSLSDKEGPFQINEHVKVQGSAAALLIELGAKDYKNEAIFKLMNLLIKDDFFHELRTKQQTAYIALSKGLEEGNQLMELFAVQSTTHYPLELLARFELFLEDFIKQLQTKVSQEKFAQMKEMYIEKLKKPFKNLAEESTQLYSLAFDEKANFDYKKELIQAVEDLTYQEFISTCESFLSRKNSKRIAILIEGKPTENKSFKYNRISKELLKQSGTYISVN